MHTTLATTVVEGSAPARRNLLVLHGVYGRGRNWAFVAKRIIDRRPDWALHLVDLRLHGSSPAMTPPHTVRAAASDLAALASAQTLTIDGVLGHSLGGKIALALADAWHDRPLQVWLIDSTPEVRPPSGEAWDMLERVRALPQTFPSREDAVAALEASGCSDGVARWMITNLDYRDGELVWRLDFDAIESLLRDFFATDLWHVLESPGPGHDVHIVKAGQSDTLSMDAVQRIAALERVTNHLHFHRIAGGHWLNTENPSALVELLSQGLPG
ncbi:MAG: alpha/beta fold hydrolase [Luteitalea sp.]|nr:alpha/beta fold hydrolase [Luteitalea sp.]